MGKTKMMYVALVTFFVATVATVNYVRADAAVPLVAIFLIILVCVLSYLAAEPPKQSGQYTKATEREFQEAHHRGEMEHRLPDGTRVDDLTRKHAIEYDFANKWAEAIGQSLYYARMSDRRAGIVLILRQGGDKKYVERITKLQLPITVWTVQNLKDEPVLISP